MKGGYLKGHKSILDKAGLRSFSVNYLKAKDQDYLHFYELPVFVNGDANLGLKHFHGKTPKEVAKKVLTELCRILMEDTKNICQPITYQLIKERDNVVLNNLSTPNNININDLYKGIHFELIDVNNKKLTGSNRKYRYYGDRVMIDDEKILKGNKLLYESYVIPIRKNYRFIDAIIDHLFKSEKATVNYNKTNNFRGRHSRSMTKTANATFTTSSTNPATLRRKETATTIKRKNKTDKSKTAKKSKTRKVSKKRASNKKRTSGKKMSSRPSQKVISVQKLMAFLQK